MDSQIRDALSQFGCGVLSERELFRHSRSCFRCLSSRWGTTWRPPDPTLLQLWKLPSFSEAAIAECQAMEMPAVPPPSQPRRGSTAPTVDLCRYRDCARRCKPIHLAQRVSLWELPSFSEAAIAECQAMEMPAVPPPSQPRRGSTAPTVDLCRCRDCASRHTANPTCHRRFCMAASGRYEWCSTPAYAPGRHSTASPPGQTACPSFPGLGTPWYPP